MHSEQQSNHALQYCPKDEKGKDCLAKNTDICSAPAYRQADEQKDK